MENLNELLGKLEAKFGSVEAVSRIEQDNPEGTCSYGCTWSEITRK